MYGTERMMGRVESHLAGCRRPRRMHRWCQTGRYLTISFPGTGRCSSNFAVDHGSVDLCVSEASQQRNVNMVLGANVETKMLDFRSPWERTGRVLRVSHVRLGKETFTTFARRQQLGSRETGLLLAIMVNRHRARWPSLPPRWILGLKYGYCSLPGFA